MRTGLKKMFVFSVYNVLPVMAKFLDLRDLKNLSAVNRTFSEITKREDLLQIVFDNSTMCLLKQARSLFILYNSIPIEADIEYNSLYHRKKLQWIHLGRLFRLALVRHGGIAGIQRAHQSRQNRIRAMKEFWLRKKTLERRKFLSRRQMIYDLKRQETLHIGLWQGIHELIFTQRGLILPPDIVYRIKVCKHISENPDCEEDFRDFVRICKLLYDGQQMRQIPDISILDEKDRYSLLRHNILWESYLGLYTNYEKLQISFPLRSQQEAIRSSIPFYAPWPWKNNSKACLERFKQTYDIENLVTNFAEWRQSGLLTEATVWEGLC